MDSPEEPTREMLHQAYLSHLQRFPRSAWHRLTFEQALASRVHFLALRGLVISARRVQEARSRAERPTLELT